jgi:hypothetical protein
VYDAADDAAIVRPLDAPYIRRQVRFDPIPLLIAQPKQVPAQDPDLLPKTNQDRIVRPEKLMSSDPSSAFPEIGAPVNRQKEALEGSLGDFSSGPATSSLGLHLYTKELLDPGDEVLRRKAAAGFPLGDPALAHPQGVGELYLRQFLALAGFPEDRGE